MPSKVWGEISYPNGYTVEVWEWINNFIPHFMMDVITYPCWNLKLNHVSKRGLRNVGKISQYPTQCITTRERHVILHWHKSDVIMGSIASQITSLTFFYLIVYSDADQRKHQSSESLAFVRGITPHKWPVTRKMFSIWWRHHGVYRVHC